MTTKKDISEAARTLGQKGGRVKSAAKTKSSQRNGLIASVKRQIAKELAAKAREDPNSH